MKIKADKNKIDSTEQLIDSEKILDIEKESLRLIETANATQTEMSAFYTQMLQEDFDEAEARNKSDSLKRATANIAKSLSLTYVVSDELNARWNDIRKQGKKHKLISSTPANATIDYTESSSEHFAKGLNLYKLLLICFVGSFVGVVIEMLWCLITNGYIESRSGLVYGPFNLLYGIGAVALTVCLYKFRNRGAWISFLEPSLAALTNISAACLRKRGLERRSGITAICRLTSTVVYAYSILCFGDFSVCCGLKISIREWQSGY